MIQLVQGSARVSRALVGVPPTHPQAKHSHHSVYGLRSEIHRRDANGCNRDGRASNFQLDGSGEWRRLMASENKKRAKGVRTPGRAMPKISDAEWIVMKVAWEKSAFTANQVVQALENKMHWKAKTIHTLLTRLVRKGALDCDKSGREYLFQPLVEAKDCLREVSRSFLSRFFGGEVAPFLACFLETEKLSAKEIEELRRVLDGKQR